MTRPTYPTNATRSRREIESQPSPSETVSGRWLVKALLATLVAAGVALYLTVCLLFYQGQWQFIFFPPKQSLTPPALFPASAGGLPITDVKFDYTEEGTARLDGWWIAADTNRPQGKNPSNAKTVDVPPLVVLFCPNGRTVLSGNIVALEAFHALGLSVFAFDYRGFGLSHAAHPTQQKAYADGLAALHYLLATRHIDPTRIVIYGAGVGAAVAVHTARQTTQIAGLILENPQLSFVKEVKREQHIHVLPLWLIFPDRFDISQDIPELKMPKLFVVDVQPSAVRGVPAWSQEGASQAVYSQAVAPKKLVTLQSAATATVYSQPAWQAAMRRYLRNLR